MLKIDESITAGGELAAVFLRLEEGVLEIIDADGALPVPRGALALVMARFGAPFDPQEPVVSVASLPLDEGRSLRHVRHLAGYDVIARDYLLYETSEQEPVCVLARTLATELAHLARRSPPPR